MLNVHLHPRVLCALVVAAAASPMSCGGSDSAPPYGGVPRDQPPLTALSNTWTWIDVPESKCDDGSTTGFAVNPKDTGDLFIFFEGGGACWDYLRCVAYQGATNRGPVQAAQWATREQALPEPFDRTRDSNPFRNATMIYIPYCTGDLHVGDNVMNYTSGSSTVTYNHKGGPDTIAFLSRVASTWVNPVRVVVSGSSAGGYGAALNYDLVRRTFPEARMYLVDDAGPLLEGSAVSDDLRNAWITSWNIGGLIDGLCSGCRADFSLLHTTLTKRYPNDRMALMSSWQDGTISFYFSLTAAEFQTDLMLMINDRLVPTRTFCDFVIAGAQHTLLGTMTTSTASGQVLEPWLDTMINDGAGWVSVQDAPN